MSLIGKHYNELHDPIHTHPMENQARINLDIGNVAESTVVELEQPTSSKKGSSPYDSDNYPLPGVDEEASPPTSSENTIPGVIITTQTKTVGHNKISNGKCATIACSAFVLLFGLAYLCTKLTRGNTTYIKYTKLMKFYYSYDHTKV